MAWIAISFRLAADGVDSFGDALLEAGAVAVSVEDADAGTAAEQAWYAEPGRNVNVDPRYWANNRLHVLLEEWTNPAEILSGAATLAGIGLPAEIESRTVDDEDWVRLTQSQFGPIEISERLWIVPTWHEPPEPRAIAIRLDPGRAFGTGSHPTTRLVLEWLSRALHGRARVLDYGCGSGILAIAAAKLGADEVDAVDVDAQAILACRENCRANEVNIAPCLPADLGARQYDLVLANILAGPLVHLAAELVSRLASPRSILVLSGVLQEQANEVIAAYAGHASLAVGAKREGWVLLEGRPA